MCQFLKLLSVCLISLLPFSPVAGEMSVFTKLYLSNKGYAKHIDVKTYLILEDQLGTVFNSADTPIYQMRNRDLYNKKLYLVVQCRNVGERYAWGEVGLNVNNMNITIPAYCSELPGDMKGFCNCSVIHFGEGWIPNNDDFPKITYFWKELYTY